VTSDVAPVLIVDGLTDLATDRLVDGENGQFRLSLLKLLALALVANQKKDVVVSIPYCANTDRGMAQSTK